MFIPAPCFMLVWYYQISREQLHYRTCHTLPTQNGVSRTTYTCTSIQAVDAQVRVHVEFIYVCRPACVHARRAYHPACHPACLHALIALLALHHNDMAWHGWNAQICNCSCYCVHGYSRLTRWSVKMPAACGWQMVWMMQLSDKGGRNTIVLVQDCVVQNVLFAMYEYMYYDN